MVLFSLLFHDGIAKDDSTRFAIRKIMVHGTYQYSTEKITKLYKDINFSLPGLEQSTQQILTQYQQDGYYFSAVDSVVVIFDKKKSKADLLYFINEQSKLKANKILINSDNSAQKQTLESLIDLRGQEVADLKLVENIELLLTHLENNGYPFSQIDIDSLILKKDNQLDTYLSVFSGPLVKIDKITIAGNKTTKDNVIIREIRIRQGETSNQKKVSKIPNRLQKLGFFKQVDEAQVVINSEGNGELLIKVVEGNMNKIDGVLGYNPGTELKKGFFTGLIDISLANVLGSGRKIETYWEKKDLKTQQLKFRYQEPWLLGFPVHVGGSFQQLIQDTSYIKRNWALDVNLPISENVILFADMGKEAVSPDSIGYVLWNIPKSKTWLFNLGIIYDTRNDPINPGKGVLYQTTVEIGRKKVDQAVETNDDASQEGTFDRRKITMDAELLIPTFKWQVISLTLCGRQVTSDEFEVSISDMFRFGGSKSVRGYREDEFWGSQIGWANAEYRYLLSPRSRVFLFFDSGYYSRKTATEGKIENYIFGYGFGLRIDTRLGIIGVDYGLAEGRSLTNGLVHVRLVNKF